MSSKTEQFSVFSWNVLADCFAMDGKFSLDHVPPEDLLWANRCQRILGVILSEMPAVVCLQEVMNEAFARDFQPALEAQGYEALMQPSKWKEGAAPSGNATFWRKDKFRLAWQQARSRIHTVILEDHTARRLALLNCHLEGAPTKSAVRVAQLQNSLQMLSQQPHHACMAVGDFNCELRSSACASYLAFGFVSPGVLEWGREVPALPDVVPHNYPLATAYVPNQRDFSFTVSGASGFCGMLDQLWYTQSTLQLQATRPVFSSEAQRAAILARGLPSDVNPSDHLPVGASFSWHKEIKPFGVATQSLSTSDPLAEVAILLENCPWTDAQRIEWMEVTAVQQVSKKPSPEQLAAIKALSARKQTLLGELSEDARQILKRVVTLQKQAAKTQTTTNTTTTTTTPTTATT